MMGLTKINRRCKVDKIFDGCSLFGVMNLKGERFSSRKPVEAISNMHERGNGLGGGFAVYGLYPEHKEDYAFHIMYLDEDARYETERLLNEKFNVLRGEEVPTEPADVQNPPLIRRYFVQPGRKKPRDQTDNDYVMEHVMRINTETGKAFVFSSGKNMAVFKGVGYPKDIAEYFCLHEYHGYMWLCHGRFPTNTPGWWGGAHPFNILGWTVVHNGELSSYGINRRYLEMYGYQCTLQTDTEVLAYAFDLLMRRHKLPLHVVSQILAPRLWTEIKGLNPEEAYVLKTLRQTYGSLLMNGPFSVIVARHGEMIGLTDRIKLRPLTAGIGGDFFYLSSEEASIHLVAPSLDKCWNVVGGAPIVGRVRNSQVLEVSAR
ncbi:MAG: class II glutamine amidotransferase [Thermoproteota archaeon]